MSKQVILNTGDWHLSSEEKMADKAEESIKQIIQHCDDNRIDYIKIDGDLWDEPQREPYYSTKREGRGVELARYALKELSKRVQYITIISGNREHDAVNSISKLHQLWADNILAYEYPVVLAFEKGKYYDLFRQHELIETINPDVIFPLMPYPNKSLLMEYHDSVKESNEEFGQIFDGLMQAFGVINNKFNCPKIMGFHGTVQGGRLSNGQTTPGEGIIISPHSLMKANCDFYNLQHYHLPQWLIENVMGYTGSLYNINYGETEQKYFTVTEFENGNMEVKRIPLTASKPMFIVKGTWDKETKKIVFDAPIDKPSETRVDFDIPKSEREFFTKEIEKELKEKFNGELKLNPNVIQFERESRSERIMDVKTEEEEVEEWLNVMVDDETKADFPTEEIEENGEKVIRYKLTKSMLDKISKIREAVQKNEKVAEEVE